LGDRAIPEVVEHALLFVNALDRLASLDGSWPTVVDLGSGGGVPGLVIAQQKPELKLVLLDRRTKRTDFLQRIVSRLGWGERVDVIAGDAEQFRREYHGTFDCVVARGFGPPKKTLMIASSLIRAGGRVVISEPPEGDRWGAELLASMLLERLPSDRRMAVFQGKHKD
jgi:16S rRNA (guanine527-N7)-methyltransferase